MALTFDQVAEAFKKEGAWTRHDTTFLPEPERRARPRLVISVDDHLVEPPDTFEGRLSAKYVERGPRVIEHEGGEAWVYDGVVLPNVGLNAVAGRPVNEYSFDPTRFEEMRRGAYDVHARVADMDLNGIYASLNFPSFLAGFGGARLQLTPKDPDLAFAVYRAYNDWHIESWAGAYPDRFIANQIPWLLDPEVGAEEIRRNAERGFKSVSFPETPEKVAPGFASLHSGHWDPIFRACAETDTVINVHTGSAGTMPATAPDAPADVPSVLFGAYAIFPAVDWLYSKLTIKFPTLKVAFSEGGIGWVAMLLDRLDHGAKFIDNYGTWSGVDVTPAEALRRNFWFCFLDDPSSMNDRHRIGVDHLMYEVDYPHVDTSWPDSQDMLARHLEGVSEEEAELISWKNAAALYRHEVSGTVRADPNAF